MTSSLQPNVLTLYSQAKTCQYSAAQGALPRQIDQPLTKEAGVTAYVAEAPMACVALGADKALENYAIIRRSIGGL